jgi:hypothetical protein
MNSEVWAIILGVVVMGAATYLKKCQWSKPFKVFVVVLLAFAMSLAQEVFYILLTNNPITIQKILVDAGIIFATASTLYTTIWEKIEANIEGKH